MGQYRHRKPIEAHQVHSGAKKCLDKLPFQGEATYREFEFGNGVQIFEDDGMDGNWTIVNKGDWIVKDMYGDFVVVGDNFFRKTFEEVTE